MATTSADAMPLPRCSAGTNTLASHGLRGSPSRSSNKKEAVPTNAPASSRATSTIGTRSAFIVSRIRAVRDCSVWPGLRCPHSAKPQAATWSTSSGRSTRGAIFNWSVGRLEVHGRRTAALGGDLVVDLLAFVEAVQARTLDRADMHEHILAAVTRLDESETLGGVEPLHRTSSHHSLSSAV